jgi:hypothetical protein
VEVAGDVELGGVMERKDPLWEMEQGSTKAEEGGTKLEFDIDLSGCATCLFGFLHKHLRSEEVYLGEGTY